MWSFQDVSRTNCFPFFRMFHWIKIIHITLRFLSIFSVDTAWWWLNISTKTCFCSCDESNRLLALKNNYKKLYTVVSCLGVLIFCTCCKILICLLCFVASFKLSCVLTVCIVVVVLCVLLSYVYLLYCVGIAFFFTLDARRLARSQYSEGPATGHLDTGFSWFPCA